MTGWGRGRLVRALLADREEQPALRQGEITWTYGDLRRGVETLRSELVSLGLAPGMRVLLAAPNSIEYVATFLAVTAAGGIVVPCDVEIGTTRLRALIEDAEPGLAVVPAAFDLPPALTRCRVELGPDGAIRTTEVTECADGVSAAEPAASSGVLLYSSGTTGRPKGVPLTESQLLTIARSLAGTVGLGEDHRELILCPLTHSGAWQRITATLSVGGQVFFPDGLLTVSGLLEDVERYEITGFFSSPPWLRLLLREEADRVRSAGRSLRTIETASAPLAADEVEELLERLPGCDLHCQYGLTECSRAIMLDARAHPDKRHTVGRPTRGIGLRIADENGRPLPPGTRGEILLSGPQRVEGYWRRPDLDRERLRDEWLRTGDVGVLDGEGFLTLVGREDDLINCGGISYHPSEVESALSDEPGVAEVVVCGVTDPQGLLHQVPWAFVVESGEGAVDRTALRKAARQSLDPARVPRRFVFLPELPRTPTGKISRRLLVEGADAGTGEEGTCHA